MQSALARNGEHVEDLAVVELEVVVGHVGLERGVAFVDQRGQFVLEHLRRRIAHDQVEGVVDMRLAFGAAVVVLDRGAQRVALFLRGERNHGRRAAAGRRARARIEVVGHAHRRGHRLIQMAVCIDAAGRHDAAGRIDLLCALAQGLAEHRDPAVADSDVGREAVARGRDLRIAHDQVERAPAHRPLPDASDPCSETRKSANNFVDNIMKTPRTGA